MASIDLEELYEFAIKLAQEAGDLIKTASLERNSSGSQASSDATKKNRVDLVTKTDKAVEKHIKDAIAARYPTHTFLGEESDGAETIPFTDEPTWIVDPIDGTTNFVHGFPHVCVSIGFTLEKKPVVGVIYNPFLLQLYSARSGGGAFLNRTTPLPLAQEAPPLGSLADALIGVEWGNARAKSPMEKKAASFVRLAETEETSTVVSAALNYAMVASGQLDIFWEVGPWPWDVCAGTVIVQEAGGKAYGRGGKVWENDDMFGRHFFVIRAIGDSDVDKGSAAQDKIAKQFFDTVVEYETV